MVKSIRCAHAAKPIKDLSNCVSARCFERNAERNIRLTVFSLEIIWQQGRTSPMIMMHIDREITGKNGLPRRGPGGGCPDDLSAQK